MWGNETDPIVPCLPSQELTGTHSFPPKGPNQQRPGVLTKGLATKGAGSERGGHPRDCGHVTPGTGLGRRVTLEIVDMRPQVQGLGEGVTLETVDM